MSAYPFDAVRQRQLQKEGFAEEIERQRVIARNMRMYGAPEAPEVPYVPLPLTDQQASQVLGRVRRVYKPSSEGGGYVKRYVPHKRYVSFKPMRYRNPFASRAQRASLYAQEMKRKFKPMQKGNPFASKAQRASFAVKES